VAAALADLKGLPVAEVAAATTRNFEQVFSRVPATSLG
jgi:Tat protein secretion system quality control protein TatD with DNase activity